jgi:hypothetical protein
VTSGGVLAGRRKRYPPKVSGGYSYRIYRSQCLKIRHPQALQVRDLELPLFGYVAQRVAATVAVLRRVRHFADSERIQYDENHSVEFHLFSWATTIHQTSANDFQAELALEGIEVSIVVQKELNQCRERQRATVESG